MTPQLFIPMYLTLTLYSIRAHDDIVFIASSIFLPLQRKGCHHTLLYHVIVIFFYVISLHHLHHFHLLHWSIVPATMRYMFFVPTFHILAKSTYTNSYSRMKSILFFLSVHSTTPLTISFT